MLMPMSELLQRAQQEHYAVAAFNTYNYASIAAAIKAAHVTGKPVIVAFGQNVSHIMDLDAVAATVRTLSEKVDVPVALHLDHSQSIPLIIQAIRAGFTSVMFDGSALDFRENVNFTKQVADIAHAVGVSVEAELGGIAAGRHSDEADADEVYTDPEQAVGFCNETGVDALAVSIGTVHGMYKGEPNIDLERLKRIRELIETPLVLHGGSGTPHNILLNAVQDGICKVNVNTEISQKAVMTLTSLLNSNPNYHLSYLTESVKKEMIEHMTKFINLLGS